MTEFGTPPTLQFRQMDDSDVPDEKGILPLDARDTAVQALAFIDLALDRGTPWGVLAAQLGMTKGAAKKTRASLRHSVHMLQAGLREPVYQPQPETPGWFDIAAAEQRLEGKPLA